MATPSDYAMTGRVNLTYNYSPTQNNGQISSIADAVSGETVTYAYDSLSRLIWATATGSWGLSFSYDGFGNRTSQTVTQGSGPTVNLAYSASTNRITTSGYGYDSNGNLTSMPGMTLAYDMANRLISTTGSGTEIYAYDPNNQRVYRRQPTLVEHYTLYGMKGERLGIYKPALYGYETVKLNFYFGGRLIREGDTAIVTNHVGTVVNNGPRLYPYGEAQSGAASGEKFATYYRDSTTALDYARNRYYSSTLGRFLTVDPLGASGKPDNPQSWHRYTYGQDDPVNQNDPSGLIAPGDDPVTPEPCFIDWSVPMGLRQCGDQFDPFPFLRYAIKAWPAPFVPPPTVAGGGGGSPPLNADTSSSQPGPSDGGGCIRFADLNVAEQTLLNALGFWAEQSGVTYFTGVSVSATFARGVGAAGSVSFLLAADPQGGMAVVTSAGLQAAVGSRATSFGVLVGSATYEGVQGFSGGSIGADAQYGAGFAVGGAYSTNPAGFLTSAFVGMGIGGRVTGGSSLSSGIKVTPICPE
ncbi:MAG: RHS repeat-associated core domain-containing protein [Acidobacteriota bacterium]